MIDESGLHCVAEMHKYIQTHGQKKHFVRAYTYIGSIEN